MSSFRLISYRLAIRSKSRRLDRVVIFAIDLGVSISMGERGGGVGVDVAAGVESVSSAQFVTANRSGCHESQDSIYLNAIRLGDGSEGLVWLDAVDDLSFRSGLLVTTIPPA